MIIVDYSQIALASIIVQRIDDPDLIRHICLNTLRMYNKKYREEYGQMVLACDGFNSWRKQFFPEYKGNRKKNRSASELDWNLIFGTLNDLREEIKDNFPWKVLHLDECEADDIIGTLCENSQEFGQYEDIMIVSADHDFKQLQRYDNVSQFSPLTKKYVEESHPRQNLKLKILQGDGGDGVPNVLSDDNVFVEGRRQTPLSKKKKEAILRDLGEGELLYAASWYRNYCRNETLIDLTKTPDRLKEKILEEYKNQDPWNNKGLVFPYLINKNMKQLIESVEEFV